LILVFFLYPYVLFKGNDCFIVIKIDWGWWFNLMAINVKFFATFRDLLGLKELELETKPGENLKLIDLLERLFQKFGEKFRSKIFENGDIRPQVNIMINGRNIKFLNRINSLVKDGDIVAIFPPVAGG
jgi:molybdopterin synthase sulfur carrier subunit